MRQGTVKIIISAVLVFGSAPLAVVFLLLHYPLRQQLGPVLIQVLARGVLAIWRLRPTLSGPPLRCPDPRRAVLVVANHVSFLDIAVMAAMFRAVFVSKREVLFWPFVGVFGALAGVLYLDRSQMRQRVKMLKTVSRHLRPGRVVCVFPQGTTSAGTSPRPFQRGIFKTLDVNPALCLLPVTLAYAGRGDAAWQDESMMANALRIGADPALTVTVMRHPPLTAEECRRRDTAAIARQVEQTVLAPLMEASP